MKIVDGMHSTKPKQCEVSFYKLRIRSSLTIGLIFGMLIFLSSCKKYIEVEAPANQISSANVYTSDATAAAVLTDIYTKISRASFLTTGISSMPLLTGLSSDELTLFSGASQPFIGYYNNNLSSTVSGFELWKNIYPMIFVCNSAIQGLTESESLTPAIKDQLIGEAKFMRAFFYFYLVNLYGDVPLALSTDYKKNAQLMRSSVTEVYDQIISDLKNSQSLLSDQYLKADAFSAYNMNILERVRPTKWAATALLARVYLYSGNWSDAEAMASIVIENSTFFGLETLDGTFLKNNKEAIWQLQPVNSGWNTEDAKFFTLTVAGPNPFSRPVYLSSGLLNCFEVGDGRRSSWIGSITTSGGRTYYFPRKYKLATFNSPVSEYSTILRLGEQYLVRAEARAQQNNITGAKSDLNAIRSRANLSSTTADDKNSLLSAILSERRVELFTEWGHRWLDLKRMDKVNDVMSLVSLTKGGAWQPADKLYPLPLDDLKYAPKLVQNEGY